MATADLLEWFLSYFDFPQADRLGRAAPGDRRGHGGVLGYVSRASAADGALAGAQPERVRFSEATAVEEIDLGDGFGLDPVLARLRGESAEEAAPAAAASNSDPGLGSRRGSMSSSRSISCGWRLRMLATWRIWARGYRRGTGLRYALDVSRPVEN